MQRGKEEKDLLYARRVDMGKFHFLWSRGLAKDSMYKIASVYSTGLNLVIEFIAGVF